MFIRPKGAFQGSEALRAMEWANARGDGVVTEVHSDDVEGILYVRETQDVEPILEANKLRQEDSTRCMDGLGYWAARIPDVIWEKWRKEIGFSYAQSMSREFEAYVRKKLNDPENAFLRIWKGRL